MAKGYNRFSKPTPKWIDPPNCRSLRQGDEWICPQSGCGLRWDVGESRPLNCPLKGK